MPLLFLEVPPGLNPEAKGELLKRLTDDIDNTYHFPDTRVFLREYPAENTSQDGAVGAPLRPVAFLEAPELRSSEQKRRLVADIHATIDRSYHDLADVDQTLVLINQYPLENVGWLSQLQSDNAMIVQAVENMNASPAAPAEGLAAIA